MPRPQKLIERENTRKRLVEAAAALFHEHGFAATGTSEIQKAARTGAGSMYHHFGTKEGLLLAVLTHYRRRFRDEIAPPPWEGPEGPAMFGPLFAVLGFYREFLIKTDFRLGCPIGNLAGELSDTHPEVREALATTFDMWRREIQHSLKGARPYLRTAISTEALSTFVLSVMEGAVMQSRVHRSIEPYDQSLLVVREYFEQLLEEPSDADYADSSRNDDDPDDPRSDADA